MGAYCACQDPPQETNEEVIATDSMPALSTEVELGPDGRLSYLRDTVSQGNDLGFDRQSFTTNDRVQEVPTSDDARLTVPAPKKQLGLSEKDRVLVINFLQKNKFPGVNDPKSKTGCMKGDEYPLHEAVKQNQFEVVKALLAAGADRSLRNHKRQTAEQMVKKNSPLKILFEEANKNKL